MSAFGAVAPWWCLPLALAGGGATAFARMRDKRHWVSDTAAAALIGFGIGAFVAHRREEGGLRPLLVPGGGGVQWRSGF